MRRLNNSAFTIIELMIASTVFSVILLVLTSGLLQVGRLYFKGVTASKTQEATRSIIDEISREIQFSGKTIKTNQGTSPDVFCIGDSKYVINLNKVQGTDPENGLFAEEKSQDCSATSSSPTTAEFRVLTPTHMRINNLSVSNIPGTNLYTINVKVIYGPADLSTSGQCDTSIRAGGQFCAVSELSTTVEKRVN
jgi:prepilin-type N-terminal cleavage/methylation domain-containing protein